MLDIKLLRENAKEIQKKIRTKEPDIDLQPIIGLDSDIRKLKSEVEEIKAKRNAASKQIGEMKQKGQNTDSIMQEVAGLGKEIQTKDAAIKALEEKLELLLAKVPNLPMEDVAVSQDVKDNVVIKEFGKKPSFSFSFQNHLELNERLKLFDFERGAKMSGSGWPVYSDQGARLEWALLNLMIDVHLEKGFKQWMLPLLVRPEMMFGSAQLPKFMGQFYQLDEPEHPLYLIPTGEVALNALHYDEILEAEDLPYKYITYTPCFRREAGAAGKQERGLIRTHQFNKVEMFAFCKPEDSPILFKEFIKSAELILQKLELHYRVVCLVTGDMSFSAAKTVDLEVYLPGQERYYEVSSVSNCTDFQSRRSKTRYRESMGKPQLVHTLNGSGLATSRLMVGLLENHQKQDGSVHIPEALRPYLGGKEVLLPN